jgi:hypothetical protein
MRSVSLFIAVPAAAALVACGAESNWVDDAFLKPPHWVESQPAPGVRLTAAPSEVSIRFDFNLHRSKTGARVRLNGNEIPSVSTVSENRKILTEDLQGTQGDGQWFVNLDACWPDGSCHKGQFASKNFHPQNRRLSSITG